MAAALRTSTSLNCCCDDDHMSRAMKPSGTDDGDGGAPEFPPKWYEEVGSRVGRRRGRADQGSRTWVVSAVFLPTSSRSLSSRNSDHFASPSENSGARASVRVAPKA